MEDAGAKVVDLIFGRWRSQILYTGVKLGVFDALTSGPKNAVRVASDLGVEAGMLYRLMRALGVDRKFKALLAPPRRSCLLDGGGRYCMT
jgi:Dimerisation domain